MSRFIADHSPRREQRQPATFFRDCRQRVFGLWRPISVSFVAALPAALFTGKDLPLVFDIADEEAVAEMGKAPLTLRDFALNISYTRGTPTGGHRSTLSNASRK
jgi:hypothetical protein